MKAAAVVFKKSDFESIKEYRDVISFVRSSISEAQIKNLDLIVFPALLGCLHGNWKSYLEDILKISINYKDISICPGSYYEETGDKTYHSSSIIKNGRILLKQRGLYLAKWERSINLSRGRELEVVDINGFKTAIILSTDAFYPQVARQAALRGANLVLYPMAVRGTKNPSLQISGPWNSVQSNFFFGIESGLKGDGFFSYSAIHSPLEMTELNNGFATFEGENTNERILSGELSEEKRQASFKSFNLFSQFNYEAYKDIFR